MSTKIIKLNADEFWPLLNILNEVCHGIKISNFENSIGAKKRNCNSGAMHLDDLNIKAVVRKKRHHPALISTMKLYKGCRIPWLGDRQLKIEVTSNS